MQHKTLKSRQKYLGMTLETLHKFRFRTSAQVQDTAMAMAIERESWRDDANEFSPRGVLERSCLESESSFSSSSYMPDSSSITLKTALLSRSSSRDEVVKLHQHSCLSVWKDIVLRRLHFCSAKQSFRSFSLSLYSCSVRGISKLHRGRSVALKAIISEEKPCETDTHLNLGSSWRCFTYEEIAHATNHFNPDNIVGKGGYADVYKGTLTNGHIIAVKRLIQEGAKEQQREKEFLEEIGIMGHLCHPNIAPLIGFCLEGGLYLVFHFYPYGSLASLLHGNKHHVLDWPIRFKMALCTARGIHYLHNSCQRRIIHRDIKASNILVGSDFEPQISDFGLAKWLPTHWTHYSLIPVEGTFGYLAPEYFMYGIVDEKTDVFAFGVLLLEIISGRRPIDTSQRSLVLWARPLLESENIEALADPELRGSYDSNQMQHLMLTAAMCTRQSAISRPSMSQVLELLAKGYCLDFPTC